MLRNPWVVSEAQSLKNKNTRYKDKVAVDLSFWCQVVIAVQANIGSYLYPTFHCTPLFEFFNRIDPYRYAPGQAGKG